MTVYRLNLFVVIKLSLQWKIHTRIRSVGDSHIWLDHSLSRVIIFGSIRFLSKRVTKIKFWKTRKFEPEPNRNRFKPTGFGPVRFDFFNIETRKTYISLSLSRSMQKSWGSVLGCYCYQWYFTKSIVNMYILASLTHRVFQELSEQTKSISENHKRRNKELEQ